MTSKSEALIVADVQEWKKQLITKEDPMHLHKTLGVLCLLSFIWRYAHIGSSDMGFLSHPQLTIPTLCLHLMLTASAFEFKIPARRIKDGTRIWPEYRMHAMVFLCRSVAIIAMFWYEEQHGLKRHYDINLVIVLASMAAADLCSASVGQEFQSNSVRDIDTHPAVKYFFSVMQFYATAGFITGLRRYSFPFLSVMVVQLTPFLGTLRRKHLIGANFAAFLYGLFLVSSYFISVYFSPGGTLKQLRLNGCFGLTAAVWRLAPAPSFLKPLQNKYIVWTSIGLIMRYYRPMFSVWTINQVMFGFRIALAATLALGYWKINYGYNNSKGSVNQEKKGSVTKKVS
jgi:hypothetical protein